MNRMMAIVEREMRKFFRSPTLMLASMIFPLVQLIVLGNAFGGKIKDARLGVVDQDGGTQALKLRQAFDSVRANMRTFVPVYYDDEKTAREDVRNGKIQGAVIIPPQYSRRVYEQNHPQIGLVVDNSDNFMSSTLEQELDRHHYRAEHAHGRAAHPAADGSADCRAVSVHRVHEISAARFDHAGDVRFGDDRRRHALHRRQGPRRARRIPRDPDHQDRDGVRPESGGCDQSGADRARDHGHWFAARGREHHFQSPDCARTAAS